MRLRHIRGKSRLRRLDSKRHRSECGAALQSQRIDHIEKWEAMEISIPRANLLDAMLAHQDCGMTVMEEIAGQVRQFGKYLGGNVGMALCLN